MAVKLYVIPGSHPSKAAELMLEHKGIPFKRVDLVTAVHRPALKLLGFPGKTVPAMKADGRKFQGTREISRALDELKPDPASCRPTRSAKPSAGATRSSSRSRAGSRGGRCSTSPARSAPRRLACRCRATASGFRSESRRAPSCRSRRFGGYNNSTDEAVRADLAAIPRRSTRWTR